jgi:hypothetical protein
VERETPQIETTTTPKALLFFQSSSSSSTSILLFNCFRSQTPRTSLLASRKKPHHARQRSHPGSSRQVLSIQTPSPSSSISATNLSFPTAIDPRTEPSRGHLIFWRVVTLVSWLLVVLTSFYYNFRRPEDGDRHGHKWHRHTIWGQNRRRHTPFSLNPIIGSLYW